MRQYIIVILSLLLTQPSQSNELLKGLFSDQAYLDSISTDVAASRFVIHVKVDEAEKGKITYKILKKFKGEDVNLLFWDKVMNNYPSGEFIWCLAFKKDGTMKFSRAFEVVKKRALDQDLNSISIDVISKICE